MKNSRENYTERQIAIIENIGRRKRPSLKKEYTFDCFLLCLFIVFDFFIY